jgi:hypothetical protein
MALSQDGSNRGSPHAPTPEEFSALCSSGTSLFEVAALVGRTPTLVTKRLLKNGARLGTREEGFKLYGESERWHLVTQTPRCQIKDYGRVTDEKSFLLTSIITE